MVPTLMELTAHVTDREWSDSMDNSVCYTLIIKEGQTSRKAFRKGIFPRQTCGVSESFLEEYPKC